MRNLVFTTLLSRFEENRELVGCLKNMDETAESWRCRFPESVSPGVSPGVYTGRSRQTFQEKAERI